jgi:hypothetical protein
MMKWLIRKRLAAFEKPFGYAFARILTIPSSNA